MTIMRVQSVICSRSVVSETCDIEPPAVDSGAALARNGYAPYRGVSEPSTVRDCSYGWNRRRWKRDKTPPYQHQTVDDRHDAGDDMARLLAIVSLLGLLAFVLWVVYQQWSMFAVD